jgi:serine phosphatase RsbU (regulator of sigma subunit)
MPAAIHAAVEIPVQTRQCENCTDQAILVIDGIAQCPQHAGERIRDEHPAIIAGLVLRAYKGQTLL